METLVIHLNNKASKAKVKEVLTELMKSADRIEKVFFNPEARNNNEESIGFIA